MVPHDCTRGAHFDNYPHERYLGASPARHPYKDTIVELDVIVGRLLDVLAETGQLEDTIVLVSSDNGPEMETWPDAAYSPFRCAKGSTWEGGVRVPALFAWPGVHRPGLTRTGSSVHSTWSPTVPGLAGVPDACRATASSTAFDQTSFLLAPDGPLSNRKYQYYWLARPVLRAACRRVQVPAVVDLRRRLATC